MKIENTSTTQKLFLACAITDIVKQTPEAVETNGMAMMYNTEYGTLVIDFQERTITIHSFTWDERIMDRVLKLTHEAEFDLILELPNGEYNIFRYAKKIKHSKQLKTQI